MPKRSSRVGAVYRARLGLIIHPEHPKRNLPWCAYLYVIGSYITVFLILELFSCFCCSAYLKYKSSTINDMPKEKLRLLCPWGFQVLWRNCLMASLRSRTILSHQQIWAKAWKRPGKKGGKGQKRTCPLSTFFTCISTIDNQAFRNYTCTYNEAIFLFYRRVKLWAR